MGKYKKLYKNVKLLIIGSFSSKILSFILVPFYTSVLSTTEYGISDLILSTTCLLAPIFTLTVSEAVMRFALDKDNDNNQIFSIGIYTVCFGFIVLLGFSPLILLSSILRPYYLIFLIYYFTHCIHEVISLFVKGIERVDVFSFNGVLGTIIIIICNIIFLVYMRIGIVGYLLSYIISSILTSIYMLIVIRGCKYLISLRKINKTYLYEMYKYCVPMIPNSLSWWVSQSSDKYFVTAFCGVAVNGIYSVAYKIPTIMTTISSLFVSAWQISAVEDFGTEKSKKFYADMYNKYSSIVIITSSILIVVTKIVAKILFNKSFFQGWLYAPTLVFAFLFNTMASFLGTIYVSAKRSKGLMYSTLLGAGINIILNFILISQIGALGAAIATLISYFSVWIYRVIDTRKIINITIDFKKSIICYLVIVMQIILICFNRIWSFPLALALFIIIVIIQRQFLLDIKKILFGSVKRLKKHN